MILECSRIYFLVESTRKLWKIISSYNDNYFTLRSDLKKAPYDWRFIYKQATGQFNWHTLSMKMIFVAERTMKIELFVLVSYDEMPRLFGSAFQRLLQHDVCKLKTIQMSKIIPAT